MPEMTPLSPELSRSVSALALVAARTWSLYPSDYPAVCRSVVRLAKSIEEASRDQPFAYRIGLDQVETRAASMASEVPADLAAIIDTLDQENVRRLSVLLLVDLFLLERDAARAPELEGGANNTAGVVEAVDPDAVQVHPLAYL